MEWLRAWRPSASAIRFGDRIRCKPYFCVCFAFLAVAQTRPAFFQVTTMEIFLDQIKTAFLAYGCIREYFRR